MERAFKKAALDVEILQEEGDKFKAQLKQLEKAAKEEAEASKGVLTSLLNERSEAAKDLEQVLVSLSSDPEIKAAQETHEAEKAEVTKKSFALNEEIKAAEGDEQEQRGAFEEHTEGVCSTARNLGQMAAYFLQRNLLHEAADFYMQAKSIFDSMLGPDHPKTQAWQQDLFFLINAPAIQQMVKEAQPMVTGGSPNGSPKNDTAIRNLIEMGNYTKRSGEGSEGEDSDNWWMENLFAMDVDGSSSKISEEEGADFMQVLFGTPRENGETTPRGGPAFTPRGTLVALSEVNGNKGAAISLGKPLQKQSGIPEDQQVDDVTVNMDFAKDWIQKIFETPRGEANRAELEEGKSDAFRWLQENFGPNAATARGVGNDEENRPPIHS